MDGALLSTQIIAALTPWNGVQLVPFSTALGMGIVNGLKGKLQFQTADAGTLPGLGKGVGVGIKGVQDSLMSQIMFDKGQSYWSPKQNNGPGTQWKIFCDKLSLAVKLHLMATAMLQSQHPPVFAGTGKVVKYFGVTPDAVKGAIVSAAPPAWAKERFPELAEAVATGVVNSILQHSPIDTVAIAGSPAGTPAGGSGKGIGIVL